MIKNNINLSLLLLSVLILQIGCNKWEEAELTNDKIEVIASGIENTDTNSPDYWDDALLVWSDEFNDTSLNTEKWGFSTRKGGFDDGGTELQDYKGNQNIDISNGTLKIIAKKEADGAYTSSRIASNYSFKYGRMEIRAKIPADKGNGIISRLFMLGSNKTNVGYPACGEVDMVGYLSHMPNSIFAAVHTSADIAANGSATSSGPIDFPTVEEEFHIYGFLMTDNNLKIYVDDIDNIILTYTKPANSTAANWPFDQGLYFLMNVGIGGKFAGVQGVDDTIFPTTMEVDYVRVYHPK